MTYQHETNPIIRTSAFAILEQAATTALETAQLAIARGPAGIGKSFALTLLERYMSNDRDRVYVFTATSRNGRSEKRFFEEAIHALGLASYGGGDSLQRLQRALMQSYPFRPNGLRVLLIIDECQHLDAKMIECLRYLFDVGAYARDFDASRPAFGILLVGNAHFLSRGGRAERAAFEALLTRCALEVTLDRPGRDEINDLAQSIFPEDQDLRAALAERGAARGNLRTMVTSVSIARQFAGVSPLTLAHLQKAFLFTAGGEE